MYVLLYLPILVLVVFSFNSSRTGYRWGGLSLEWYESLFNNHAMVQAMWNSLWLALAGLVAATLTGCSSQEEPQVLNVYNWSEYMPQEVLDSFVIPKNAGNPDAARQFISFVMQPEISALISEDIGYATPNLAARELLSEEVANDRTSYPTPEDLTNAEFQEDVGDDAMQVYTKYWEMLKSGQ